MTLILVMAAAMVLASLTAANASGANGDETIFYGPSDIAGTSNGRAIWDNPSYVQLIANPFGITGNKCITIWFDWRVSSGHYDARAARSCQNRVSVTGTVYVDNGLDMQKLAVCHATNQVTTPCKQHPDADIAIGAENGFFPNFCTRTWHRMASGFVEYHDGGSRTSCSS